MPSHEKAGQPNVPGVLVVECDDLICSEPANLWQENLIVDRTKEFYLSVKLSFTDNIASGLIWLLDQAQAGNGPAFSVRYSYESLGGGPEGSYPPKNVTANAGQLVYENADTGITVPANSMPVGHFRMLAFIKCNFPSLGFITGYVEGPIVQFYEP